VTFPEQVRLAGATPVFLPTAGHDFQIDPDEVERRITPRTRGIILNTPHNPTGVVYGVEALTRIGRLVVDRGLMLVFDECYDELVYPPTVHSNIVRLVPELKERTVLVGSFSKTYCMAGWRAGYVAGPAPVIKAISNLQSHTASNPSNLVQYAALAALDPVNDPHVRRVREQLRGQRQTALAMLAGIPDLSTVVPAGAFYLFPDVSALLGRSIEGRRLDTVDVLAEMLLEHAHIAVVPGSAFGSDRHIRISYAIPAEEIVAGFRRLAAFAGSLT
jgi:aspartate aminotransferase